MSTDLTIPKGERFAKGVAIIFGRQPDAEIATGHDIVYFGRHDTSQHSYLELRALDIFGWFESEDSWSFST